MENEYIRDDVNKWTDLARDPVGVRSLMEATQGRPVSSERYRDIFEPLGLQDELRAVLRIRGTCWGFICLHREAAESTFSTRGGRVPAAARSSSGRGDPDSACCSGRSDPSAGPDGPGLVLIGPDGAVAGLNDTAGRWLVELGGTADGSELPVELSALVVRLRRLDPTEPGPAPIAGPDPQRTVGPVARVVDGLPGGRSTAVIVEEAPGQRRSRRLIMVAYGLTARERAVTGLVCQGRSTRQIAEHLHLTADTVQDHLKSVFDRTGVHSRGELVATILQRDYLPRALAGDRPGRSGAFPDP